MSNTNIVVVLTYQDITNKNTSNLLSKYKNFFNTLEIRLDTFPLDNLDRISEFLRKKVEPLGKNIILTLRNYEEGGKIKLTDKQRLFILNQFLANKKNKVNFIDIEFCSKILDYLGELKKIRKLNFIISYHNFVKTNKENLKRIYSLIDFCKKNKFYAKIVLKPKNFNEYFYFLKKIKSADYNFKHTSFFCISQTSLTSRIIGFLLKMPFIYIALNKPVIKSQPSLKDFYNIVKKWTN